MLQACGHEKMRWRCLEIYIQSKLLLTGFFTLGSANLNRRSMAVDGEMNIATNEASLARGMRERIWAELSQELVNGGSGNLFDIEIAFQHWYRIMMTNQVLKDSGLKITGFLLPLADERSSTIGLG